VFTFTEGGRKKATELAGKGGGRECGSFGIISVLVKFLCVEKKKKRGERKNGLKKEKEGKGGHVMSRCFGPTLTEEGEKERSAPVRSAGKKGRKGAKGLQRARCSKRKGKRRKERKGKKELAELVTPAEGGRRGGGERKEKRKRDLQYLPLEKEKEEKSREKRKKKKRVWECSALFSVLP